jgi:hypothetical protein
MSFVSKGEKKMRNGAKAAGESADRPPVSSRFVKKGQVKKSNSFPEKSGDAAESASPVSEKESKGSSYDPAEGKRASSVADLRNAAKLVAARADTAGMAGEDSATGSEGGQDGKHSSSKNATGYMKGSKSGMEKESQSAPDAPADQMADQMEDPADEDMVDNGMTEEGMTPKGKKRKSVKKMNPAQF